LSLLYDIIKTKIRTNVQKIWHKRLILPQLTIYNNGAKGKHLFSIPQKKVVSVKAPSDRQVKYKKEKLCTGFLQKRYSRHIRH